MGMHDEMGKTLDAAAERKARKAPEEGQHASLAEALLAFQAEAPSLPKDGHNPHFKSRFTKLDTIRERIGPLLVKHGLVWQTFPCFGPNGEPALRYLLTHAHSGDSQSDVMPLLLTKQDPQGQGSATTYGRRYSVTAVLDLVADEDDDGNSASAPGAKAKAANGAVPTVTAEDVAAIRAAMKGLAAPQIQLAFAAVGLDATKPFGTIPQAKAAPLTRALASAGEKS